ncbi:MAG: hypothetical protein GXP45_06620 [bacterium]|nr:hypothetical protein [bacterium]
MERQYFTMMLADLADEILAWSGEENKSVPILFSIDACRVSFEFKNDFYQIDNKRFIIPRDLLAFKQDFKIVSPQ